MKIIRSVKQMQQHAGRLKGQGRTIGFVPTMGYLHRGHLSLVKKARMENDTVVMSIFVNPAQFGPKEDFKRYPRDFNRDKSLAEKAGVDVIFYPNAKAMYPADYQTYVEVAELSRRLCGKCRPGHFRGVATVVTKLFNIVKPDTAYFGQKDAQQAVSIKRMVSDLNVSIKIKVLPIVREPDGLAMSSRNKYLSPSERKSALVLKKALQTARGMIKSGIIDAERIKAAMKELINTQKCARIDYVSVVDVKTLEDVNKIRGAALVALAVFIGKTRLIDNLVCHCDPRRFDSLCEAKRISGGKQSHH